eukprot:Plantae.Rhodophyta-Purpureofilum_apyrenoidigerum.ctg10451.p1 GENE.Plantae.Rhodophyta-Purpureofilum_apyrenoidigerum.ctg10451~~Plantae.Rhodophyta-Purpureofilum_apyrenoidigerum.ctg10451.p1  ORF type:complete len:843 (+),score=123.95 Plantae.Rhodophyta-Purpureofilum_apyrenoidigerum.ctg10451:146-2530(+)
MALEIANMSPVSNFIYEKEQKELILCSGLDRTGTIRRVNVCKPMRVHSVSKRDFVGCNRIWSVRKHVEDRYDAFVLVSFTEPVTIVFKVDETTGSLNDTSGEFNFLENTSTLAAGLLGKDVIAQVHRLGIRLVSYSDGAKEANYHDWKETPTMKITTALVKSDHVLMSVLERDSSPSIHILQYAEQNMKIIARVDTKHEASCMDFDAKRKLLVVGTYEPSVQVWRCTKEWECKLVVPITERLLDITLPSGELAAILNMIKKPGHRPTAPESVCLLGSGNSEAIVSLRSGGFFTFDTSSNTENIVLQSKFSNSGIGRLCPVRIGSERALLLLADQVWLIQRGANRIICVPTSFGHAEAASSFSCCTLERGLLLVSDGCLCAVNPSRSSSIISRDISLKETPRRIVVVNFNGRRLLVAASLAEGSSKTPYKTILRVYDLDTNKQVASPISRPNETVHAMIVWRECVVVGFSKHLDVDMAGALRVYDLVANPTDDAEMPRKYEFTLRESVAFMHTHGVCALAHHKRSDRLILGITNAVFVCNLSEPDQHGTRTLIRESFAPTRSDVVTIHCYENFVVVGERKDSVLILERTNHGIQVVRTDVKKRAIASCLAIDEFMCIGTDKFGAFFSLVANPYCELQFERSRLKPKHTIYIGETALGIQRGRVSYVDVEECDIPASPGHGLMRKADSMIAMTINGSLIAFLPLQKRDYEVLKKVEKLMASHQLTEPLLGNNLDRYRSNFGEPVQNVIDGDLVSTFLDLRSSEQVEVLSTDTTSTIESSNSNMIARLIDLVTDLCI